MLVFQKRVGSSLYTTAYILSLAIAGNGDGDQ